MNLHLLDAGGAGLIFVALIIFILIAIAVEAIVMLLMKYNSVGKAFLDSFLVNIASLVAGFVLSSFTGDVFGLTDSYFLNWFLLYALTVAIEFLVLFLLNRHKPAGKTLLTCIVMNLITYLILLLF